MAPPREYVGCERHGVGPQVKPAVKPPVAVGGCQFPRHRVQWMGSYVLGDTNLSPVVGLIEATDTRVRESRRCP